MSSAVLSIGRDRIRAGSCRIRDDHRPDRPRPLVAVVDYGIGNLHSAHKALERLGADARLTADPGLIADAVAVVLPGVGAFGACMAALRDAAPRRPVLEAVASGRPFLGICVGMQMLFDRSEESPGVGGLGRDPGHGRVAAGRASSARRCSGTGSTSSTPTSRCSPGSASGRGSTSSTRCTASPTTRRPSPPRATTAGRSTPRSGPGNVFATQFHPEKSAAAGLGLLGNFVTSLAVPA